MNNLPRAFLRTSVPLIHADFCVSCNGFSVTRLDLCCFRYSQHTVNCARCQAALKTIGTMTQIVSIITPIVGSLALLSLASAANGGSTSLRTFLEEGMYRDNWLLGMCAAIIKGAGTILAFLTGGGDTSSGLGFGLAWIACTIALMFVKRVLDKWKTKFYTGDYPPMRNLDPL